MDGGQFIFFEGAHFFHFHSSKTIFLDLHGTFFELGQDRNHFYASEHLFGKCPYLQEKNKSNRLLANLKCARNHQLPHQETRIRPFVSCMNILSLYRYLGMLAHTLQKYKSGICKLYYSVKEKVKKRVFSRYTPIQPVTFSKNENVSESWVKKSPMTGLPPTILYFLTRICSAGFGKTNLESRRKKQKKCTSHTKKIKHFKK